MKLFEDKTRTESRPAFTNENIYKYFDNNSQTKIAEIRVLLNEWFKNYPTEHKDDLLKSFKNKFYHSFYELFIHEVFYKQGYKLEPHPKLENTEKRPDFLAVKDNAEFYIEATTISYLSDSEIRKENFKNTFIDELNKLKSPDFWLLLREIKFKNNNIPKVKLLKIKIENELRTIISENFNNNHLNILNQHLISIEDENILVNIALIKKSNKAKNTQNLRPIGIEYEDVNIKDANEDPDKIFKNFKQKANRYGILSKPFLICLNLDFKFNMVYDIDWSLYDRKCFSSLIPKFTKVSAVLINQTSVGNIFDSPRHRLILNEGSKYPINLDAIKLSYESNEQLFVKENIDKILNLNRK